MTLNRHLTPSKVAGNLFGMNEPLERTFIPMGVAHGPWELIGHYLAFLNASNPIRI
jgi:hypothetical protein